MTQEELQKELNGIKNTKMSMLSDNRLKKIMSHCKPIHQYDLEGNYIKSFESITLASKHVGYNMNDHISEHIKGRRQILAGYLWRYEKHDKIDVVIKTQKQKVNLYDLDGKLLKSFDTIGQLTKFLYPTSKKGLALNKLQNNVRKKYVIKKV